MKKKIRDPRDTVPPWVARAAAGLARACAQAAGGDTATIIRDDGREEATSKVA